MSPEQSRLVAIESETSAPAADRGQNLAGDDHAAGGAGATPASDYVVVARRYRPKAFDELVGQEHVARALSNAIAANRVGHAYLFTGARGVGKTSAARILAKALDCEQGPTATPCNRCDLCLSVASGSDVDVLEIDGASNRGIDEIRQLRQNVGVRPSRARFKIYIIDEVHMLTPQAFNALLKTLEEPPEHVKFIFCTTEANKIPITILSRCQRFDFAGIRAPSIRDRLAQIVAAEGVEAEPAALEMLARRAGGSMRDSQSLLEQLLSFGGPTIRAADVHAMLGTAGEERLGTMLSRLVERDARGALEELDTAVREGVEVGQLMEQLLSVFRDMMTAAVGCSPDAFLYTAAEAQQAVAAAGKSLGLATILGMMQILDQALARMRHSTQARILAEAALVRIATLPDLESVGELLEQLQRGEGHELPPAGAQQVLRASRGERLEPRRLTNEMAENVASAAGEAKKKGELIPVPAGEPRGGAEDRAESGNDAGSGGDAGNGGAAGLIGNGAGDASRPKQAPEGTPVEQAPPGRIRAESGSFEPAAGASAAEDSTVGDAAIDDSVADGPHTQELSDAAALWGRALKALPEGMLVANAQQAAHVAILAPNRLAIYFPSRYNFAKSYCEQPERLAELRKAVSEAAGRPLQVELAIEAARAAQGEENEQSPTQDAVGTRAWSAQRAAHPLVAATVEVFSASVIRVDPPSGS